MSRLSKLYEVMETFRKEELRINEELDFIINYDIKYRMSGELNNEEE